LQFASSACFPSFPGQIEPSIPQTAEEQNPPITPPISLALSIISVSCSGVLLRG